MARTFQQTVTNSGTPVQLSNTVVRTGVRSENDFKPVIKAKSTNAGIITLGFTALEALNTDSKHFKLQANEAIEINVNNLNEVWIDSTVSGDGVEVLVG